MNDDDLLAELARLRDAQDEELSDDERLRPLDEAEQAAIVARLTGAPPSAKVLAFPRRWPLLVVPLAAAAALAFVLLRPGTPALPAYSLVALGGGAHEARGDFDAPTWTFRRDTRLDLVVRPAATTSAEVAWRAWLAQGDRLVPWSPPVTRDPGGAFRVNALAGDVLPEGEWTLAIVVGDAPDEAAVRAAIAAGASPDPKRWQLLTRRIRVDLH
jgi:hypothetical protein